MKNKSLIIFSIILAILFISTISFATNDMGNDIKNGIHSVTDTVVDGTSNLANDVRSGIQNAENTVENGARNVGNAITDGVRDLGNTVSEGMNDVGATITDNDGYTATRTTGGDTAGTGIMNSSIWTWIILAVAAVIIVSLVWYYASQHNHIEH